MVLLFFHNNFAPRELIWDKVMFGFVKLWVFLEIYRDYYFYVVILCILILLKFQFYKAEI